MADGFEMTLDSKDLEERLRSLTGEQQQRIMAKAFRKGAEIYSAAVIEAAPIRAESGDGKSTALPPGALKSDVKITRARGTDSPEYTVGFGKLTRHVARWVEYGHRLVRGGWSKVLKNGKVTGPGQVVGNVPAHPFFRNAFESATPEAARVIAESILNDVEKIYRKGSNV